MKGNHYPNIGKIPCCQPWFYYILFFAFVFAPFGGSCFGSDFSASLPLTRNYSLEDLGISSPVWCVAEGTDGKLYAGADRLLIFDGHAWSQANVEGTPEIRCLVYQRQKVWIGGIQEVGFFEKDSAGNWKYTSVTQKLNTTIDGIVWYAYAVGDNVVFITDKKVIWVKPATYETHEVLLPTRSRLAAQKVGDEVLISQSAPNGSNKWRFFRGEGLVDYQGPADKLPNPPFDFISEQGDFLVYHSGSAIIERNRKTSIERMIYSDKGDGALRNGVVVGGVCVGDYTYVATYNSGLFIFDRDGHRTKVGRSEGLISDRGLAVAPSAADGAWVATDQGISFVSNFGVARFWPTNGSVQAIVGDESDISLGTNQVVLRRTPAGTEEINFGTSALAQVDGYTYGAKWSDIVVNDGAKQVVQILTIARQTGLSYEPNWVDFWVKDSLSVFLPRMKVPGREIINLLASTKSRDVLFASNTSSVVRIDLGTGLQTAAAAPYPTRISEDDLGNLWVATGSGGVLVFDAMLQKASLKLSSKTSTSLVVHEGHPLILREKTSIVTPEGAAIPHTDNMSRSVGSLEKSGPGWVYGRIGDSAYLGRIATGDHGLLWERKNVPDLKRLKMVSVLHVVGDNLLIGGDTGVIEVAIKSLQGPDITPPTIEQIYARNSKERTVRDIPVSVASGSTFELGNEEKEVNVSLKRRVWGLLETPLYESRLLPVEEEWTERKYGEPIVLKGLAAGQYKLQIRSRHLGETGEPMTLGFLRLPPWYASQAGITILALLGTAAFYGAVKFRTRQIEWKNRQLEEKIRQRTHELARANAAKSEFLAAMSHEIRNPMNGVVGIIKMLQDSNLGAREKYLLTTLHRCAEQLRTTVDDVLDFSKIEAGEITLHPDTFDLAPMINATINALDLTGEKLELTSWAGNRPIVTGDQGKLAQILTNFLSNALKYGVPPRASVDVFVLDEDERWCRVTIAVKNPGPDIPAAELPKLFESFQRGEFAKLRRIGGNGLGLSICKRYAEAMGGTVSATSTGGLTTFQLTVPFEKSEARLQLPSPLAPRKLTARALAIEDEDYNRLVLGSILTKLGYNVDWAADGKTALELAERHGYDLILTDWMLPDMDGGTLTKKLLAIFEEPKPPVFAITAYSTIEKQEECLRVGMAGFISKPITLEKLEAAILGWGAKKIATMVPDREEPLSSVSLQQLSKLGPIEFIVPDFARKIELEWKEIEKLIPISREQAANAAHKLVSATLLVEASILSDQLRLLEENLRNQSSDAEIENLKDICAEEMVSVCAALNAALRRKQRVNEARTPS